MKYQLKTVIILSLSLLIPLQTVRAKNKVLVVKGGEIHTQSAGIIKDGVILIEGAKIRAVGKQLAIPKGAKVIDATGMVVTPGIIDARTSYGLEHFGGQREFIQPATKIKDSLKQRKNSNWLMGGVTAVYVTPPPTSLLGGFGAVIKLVGNKDEAVIREEAGMSLSFGESALQFSSRNKPTTRQGMLGRLRQEFVRAQEYMNQRRKESGAGEVDIQLEALVKVLRREVPVRAVANTPDDIMSALRLAKEFDLKLVIDLGAGAHKVAGLLAESKVPVVVGPSIMGLGSGGPLEMYAHTPENAGLLYKAGINVALSTDMGFGRSVLLEGLIAKSHGLPENAALKAITLNAAEILGVSERLGSIEAGKDADVVIWKNHPLSTWGESQIVIINGNIVFER
ncbi:amidohydrolase family protein [Acidobacteriota bacterium]